jgi:hypothetical protein
MANHILVFCASPAPLSLREVGEYIATIGLLDKPPRFTPALASTEALDPAWSYLEITYQEGKRPIQLHRMFEADEMAPSIDDALEMLGEHGLRDEHPALVRQIQTARQIFHFELALTLPDDCWEALDALESHIATRLDGVVFASEGFYDQDLEPICLFKT